LPAVVCSPRTGIAIDPPGSLRPLAFIIGARKDSSLGLKTRVRAGGASEQAFLDGKGGGVMKGFRNFLMRGDVIVFAIGLIVALAFSGLVSALTTDVLKPLINAAASNGSATSGLGWTIKGQRIDFGAFIAAIVYFLVLMFVVYFVIVVPYRAAMRRRGTTVFGDPPATKTCPFCCSTDLPAAATRCLHCGADLPSTGS
jgi:large conductance mechanosensitive channel